MRKFSRICLILATVVTSTALLTACGGGGSAGNTETASAVTTPPAAPPSQPASNPVPSAPAQTPSTPSTPSTPDPVTSDPEPAPAPDPVSDPAPPETSAPGTATIAWVAPTLNNDGGALEELAGYRVRYGRSPDELDHSIVIDAATVLECAIEELDAGTWYFEVVAYNAFGLEGPPSNLASKTVL